MKIMLYALFIFTSILSCTKKNNHADTNRENTADTISSTAIDTMTKTYLALGDSYTIGQSVADSQRFPVQAEQVLKQQNISLDNPDIVAVTGWTTGNLLSALDNNPPKKTYSVVTLLIGVNNQYQGRSIEEYKTQLSELLSRAIAYAANNKDHVFVISIPDYSVTPFARNSDTAKIAAEIDAFNAANKNLATMAGVHYIDITPISREVKNDPSLVAGDGLHPSGLQYKKWVALLAPAMQQILQ
ncbi:MAG: SGNH/GDSL hydrolase family protein [Bacteroidota bacterium]|nr:SGNH/GDSL hydrolase family protein [Bacteroidota bacterium]